MKWLLVFLAVAALDVVWTLYIKATAEHRRAAAASWSALIIGVGGLATTEYVKDVWLLLPAAAGAWAGTWAAFYMKKARPSGIYLVDFKDRVVRVVDRILGLPPRPEPPKRRTP